MELRKVTGFLNLDNNTGTSWLIFRSVNLVLVIQFILHSAGHCKKSRKKHNQYVFITWVTVYNMKKNQQ